MILKGAIILALGGIFWFLAGSSYNGRSVLGPIYGSIWQIIFTAVGFLGIFLLLIGLWKKKGWVSPLPKGKILLY